MNEILKNKWVCGLIILTLIMVIAGWFLNFTNGNPEPGEVVNQQSSVQSEQVLTESDNPGVPDGYYYVQADEDIVNVYKYTDGEKVFYQETEIPFSMLNQEDQDLLSTGIQLKDEQELANFLENFES